MLHWSWCSRVDRSTPVCLQVRPVGESVLGSKSGEAEAKRQVSGCNPQCLHGACTLRTRTACPAIAPPWWMQHANQQATTITKSYCLWSDRPHYVEHSAPLRVHETQQALLRARASPQVHTSSLHGLTGYLRFCLKEEARTSMINLGIAWALVALCCTHHAGHALHALGYHDIAHSPILTLLADPRFSGALGAFALFGPGRT